MSQKCLDRVEALLKDSSIDSIQQDEIINQIKLAQAEKKLTSIDEINVDKVAKDVVSQLKVQRQINKRNAIENELKARNYIDYIIKEFDDDPVEGLIAILVGSNKKVTAARASVSNQQVAATNQLIAGINKKLSDANVEALFRDATRNTQRRVARTMEQIGKGLEITETNADIVKLAKIMEEYSNMVRSKLNDRGANIEKLWGYIVRQSHDPYLVRDAAKRLGKDVSKMEVDPYIAQKGNKDINYNKNFTAWKEFVMTKLDHDRTFADVDDIDEYMVFVYNSLVRNQNLKADGTQFTYGNKVGKDIAQSSKMKRVLHFKDADAWSDYNEMFGVGSLNESFFSGLQVAGRNMGMMDTLGTKPQETFQQIRSAIGDYLVKRGRSTEEIAKDKIFDKYMNVIDGSIYTVEGFGLAKFGAITRSVASMAKLGGATVSAISDVGLYGSEMRHQGRSFLGGMFEAIGSLMRGKASKDKKDIAQGLGFIADNLIYDVSARYQVGDPLSTRWTNAQRFFFKVNLLSWWTNSLKEGAMLGMANYFAKQKNIKFNDLNPQLRSLFDTYNIDSNKWDVIRKTAMESAEDGTEFINIRMLDEISDADIKKIVGVNKLTERELALEKEKFKASVSGMLLDRSTYAVIEPDAKVRAQLTQSQLAGTWMGEAIRWFGQFKAFPLSIMNKTIGRELAHFKGPNKDVSRGMVGMASMLLTTTLLGYVAMTAKDLLKGRSPRNPMSADGGVNLKTFKDAFLQGGGLGIYGDVLFQETRTSGDIVGSLMGPVPLTGLDVLQALKDLVIDGKPTTAGKRAYNAITHSIPFMNLFYIKAGFDYLIGYHMLEYMSPGTMRRLENRMQKDYDQEFMFGNPL